ncbi:hypothetical protein [Mucilaginibacter sp. UYCu711]|uniref:hypothetical protein n=1 Tax=Mucilaginibacter sp. UYCu711 TaxID=3156339 RepID=UPI003D1B95FB
MSNAINAVDGTLVLAEPTFISSLFKNYISFGEQFYQQKNQQEIEYAIKSFVDILGNTGDHHNGVYLKFTSWNTLFLQQLSKMWPNTPIVFAFRDPLDVLDSVLGKRIGWMRFYNDPVIVSALLKEKENTGDISFIDFSIKILAQLYKCGLQLSPNNLLINYGNNGAENFEKMLAHFNLVQTPQDKINIENSTLYYSKNKYRGVFFADINNGRKAILNQQILKLVEDSGIIETYKTLANRAR